MNNTWIALQVFIEVILLLYGLWALFTFIVYVRVDLPEKRRKRTIAGLYKIRMKKEMEEARNEQRTDKDE